MIVLKEGWKGQEKCLDYRVWPSSDDGDLVGANIPSSSRPSLAVCLSGLLPPAKQQLAKSMGSPSGKACTPLAQHTPYPTHTGLHATPNTPYVTNLHQLWEQAWSKYRACACASCR